MTAREMKVRQEDKSTASGYLILIKEARVPKIVYGSGLL